MELLRFVEAAGMIDATVLLAEDGPLVAALRGAGARVEVIPLSERARGLKRTEVQVGVRQAFAAVDVARYVGRLRARITALMPDVVSAVSLKAGAYGAIAARLAPRPFVWQLHDQISPSYLAPQAVPIMRAMIGTLPSAVVAPSEATLRSVGRFRRGMRTAVIPHPIPRPPEPIAIRPKVERVGIVGRLAPWKGQDVFLRAFAQAFPEGSPRAVVIGSAMFGEDDYARQLAELAGEIGIRDRVDFVGFRRDVQAEFEKLDLLVHASVLTEPFGTAVFEAMSAGLPVIAARSGGVAEYIEDGRHGLLHTPGDAAGLAALLRLAASDYALRTRLASEGRELTQQFASDRVAARWVALYQGLLGPAEATAAPASVATR